MRKIFIIVLICLGGVSGYLLARQNQKLFELPIPKEELQDGTTEGEIKVFYSQAGLSWNKRLSRNHKNK